MRRLHLLVVGAITEIVRGRATHEQVAALLAEHARKLALRKDPGTATGRASSSAA